MLKLQDKQGFHCETKDRKFDMLALFLRGFWGGNTLYDNIV